MGYAVYNPHNKPFAELPVIYGFNNGGSPGFYYAALISQDGDGLGSHVCSFEGYMLYDLGILEECRSDRHKGFQEYYPDGYRMDFVKGDDVKTHTGLQAAFKLNDGKRPVTTREDEGVYPE